MKESHQGFWWLCRGQGMRPEAGPELCVDQYMIYQYAVTLPLNVRDPVPSCVHPGLVRHAAPALSNLPGAA